MASHIIKEIFLLLIIVSLSVGLSFLVFAPFFALYSKSDHSKRSFFTALLAQIFILGLPIVAFNFFNIIGQIITYFMVIGIYIVCIMGGGTKEAETSGGTPIRENTRSRRTVTNYERISEKVHSYGNRKKDVDTWL